MSVGDAKIAHQRAMWGEQNFYKKQKNKNSS